MIYYSCQSSYSPSFSVSLLSSALRRALALTHSPVVLGAECLQNGVSSCACGSDALSFDPERSKHVHAGTPIHTIDQSLWLNLKENPCSGRLGWGGGSCELPGCLQPERVIWTEIPWHHPSCRPSWSCPHFSSLVSTYCPCPCAGLPVTRMQPRDILIHVAKV